MAINYRKRVRLGNNSRLNVSKSGVSTTVGKQGLSVNMGSRGTFLNMGIPGSGLYSRVRLSGSKGSNNNATDVSATRITELDNKGNGNAFRGCLISWPRFLLWVAFLIFLYAGTLGLLLEEEIVASVIYIVISIASYIILVYLNRGYSPEDTRPKASSRLLIMAIFVGNIVGVISTLPTFIEAKKQLLELSSAPETEPQGASILAFFIVMSVFFLLFVINNEKRPRKREGGDEPSTKEEAADYFTTPVRASDDPFEAAAKLVVTTQKASTSYLQIKLTMGFAQASRIMSQLEDAGIIGPQVGAQPRKVLVANLESLEQILTRRREAK